MDWTVDARFNRMEVQDDRRVGPVKVFPIRTRKGLRSQKINWETKLDSRYMASACQQVFDIR